MTSRHRGFTLIELLVVIAIIAILAAILFPVFARAQDKATAAACLSNIKQIILAALMYAQDYDEVTPISLLNYPGNPDPHVYPNRQYSYELIQPYIKSKDMFVCPGDPELYVPPYGVANPWPCSYGVNVQESAQAPRHNWADAGFAGCRLSNLPVPASTVGWCEARLMMSSAAVPSPGFSAPCSMWTGDVRGFGDDVAWAGIHRHNGGVNVGWADGHAKWQKIDGTTWAEACSIPNNFVTDYRPWTVEDD